MSKEMSGEKEGKLKGYMPTDCPQCNGTGEVPALKNGLLEVSSCGNCKGTGDVFRQAYRLASGQVAQVLDKYKRSWSFREYAKQINKGGIVLVSHQNIWMWMNGTHVPNYTTFLPMYLLYQDWRRDMAEEIINILFPGILIEIGRQIDERLRP